MVIDVNKHDIVIVSESNQLILFEEVFLNIRKYILRIDLGQDTIGTNSGYNSSFLKDPYFKIIKNNKYSARISLVDGRLIPKHKDKYGDLDIGNSEKKYLKNNISKVLTSGKYKGLSVFDAMWEFIITYASNNKYEIVDKSDINTVLEGIGNI